MLKYAKLINGKITFAPKNKGAILNYDLNIERLTADGYKPFIEAERHQTNRRYHIEYNETDDNILESIVYDETEEEVALSELERAKDIKIAENDRIRDEVLNQGVIYNNVLFDSDTDQKINLLATYGTMTDDSTTVWYGKDNQGLLCTKNDLLAIGNLITELHSYCWENNAYIKEQIAEAKTLDEVNEIDINYKDS